MARHRQRARERKLQQPLRENVPGELDHASAEVDEVEAAIVAGAEGEPGGLAEELPERGSGARRGARDGNGNAAGDGREVARRESAGNPVVAFLSASWAELQRVQWPDRRQVGQATAVVIGFVVVAGLYLGVADVVARKIVDAIL